MHLLFKNKHLSDFYFLGLTVGLPPHHSKIRKCFTSLSNASTLDSLFNNFLMKGFNIHKLKGRKKDLYSMKVTANYRLIFKANSQHEIVIMKIEDYH